MTERRRIFILNNPLAPRLAPELADEIGLAESILLLQIEFWISISDHNIEGKYWTYQSIRDIQKFFVFWSLQTINRTIKSLEKQNLIHVGNYNKYKYDRTRWFAMNEEGVNDLKSLKVDQGMLDLKTIDKGVLKSDRPSRKVTQTAKTVTDSGQIGTTLPDNTTEITTETTPKEPEGKPSPSSNNSKEIGIIFESMRAFYGYPDKTSIDPIPNHGKEGKAIKRLLVRGFTIEEILGCWMAKCQKAECFKSMVYVNEDIYIGKGVKQVDSDKFVKGRYGHLVKR